MKFKNNQSNNNSKPKLLLTKISLIGKKLLIIIYLNLSNLI
jgi:hypothetical protein